jgi:hypothetical protein
VSDSAVDPAADSGLAAPSGPVALLLHVFGPADRELTDVLTPPWPQWMTRLYELQSLSDAGIDLARGEVPISAAIAALKTRLTRRLDMLAWICAELERHGGWEFSLRGAELVAQTSMEMGEVRRMLEDTRLAAVLPTVCAVDGDGFPLLLPAVDLAALPDG